MIHDARNTLRPGDKIEVLFWREPPGQPRSYTETGAIVVEQHWRPAEVVANEHGHLTLNYEDYDVLVTSAVFDDRNYRRRGEGPAEELDDA